MKLYHASLFSNVFLKHYKLFPNIKINVLRSFGLLNHEMELFCVKHRSKIGSIILDSGTWTLNNANSKQKHLINLKSYQNYVQNFFKHFDFYFNFDNNFTEEGSDSNYLNQLELEGSGLKPVPVVHDIDGDEINHYVDKGYPIVALGSSQIKTKKKLGAVMEKFEGSNIKIHLFGNTRFDFISEFPIYSCDSSGWAKSGVFGRLLYWNPHKKAENKTDTIVLEDYLKVEYKNRNYFSTYSFRADLEAYWDTVFGLNYYDFFSPEGYYNRHLVNLHYFVELEKYINQIHQNKRF